MTDIVNVFKEIQMIGIHVQDDADLREEASKAVGVFAGFGDECAGMSQAQVTTDRRQDTADRDGRIKTAL